MDPWLAVLIAAATISVSGSIAVIATLLLFERMRSKLFMRIISFISLGDLVGNFPFLFPYRPSQGNWWCSLQAFMNLAGYPIDWLWTVTLVYLLFNLSRHGKLPETLWPIHCVCWLLPVILALLSLSVSNYTRPYSGIGICVENNTKEAMLYHAVTYYGLLYCCILIMITFFILIFLQQQRKDPNVTSTAFSVAKSALQWYPAAFLVFWLPHSLSTLLGFSGRRGEIVYKIFLIWKVLHGLSTSIIFFAQSSETRNLWWTNTVLRVFPSLGRQTDDTRFTMSDSIVDRMTEMTPSFQIHPAFATQSALHHSSRV